MESEREYSKICTVQLVVRSYRIWQCKILHSERKPRRLTHLETIGLISRAQSFSQQIFLKGSYSSSICFRLVCFSLNKSRFSLRYKSHSSAYDYIIKQRLSSTDTFGHAALRIEMR